MARQQPECELQRGKRCLVESDFSRKNDSAQLCQKWLILPNIKGCYEVSIFAMTSGSTWKTVRCLGLLGHRGGGGECAVIDAAGLVGVGPVVLYGDSPVGQARSLVLFFSLGLLAALHTHCLWMSFSAVPTCSA